MTWIRFDTAYLTFSLNGLQFSLTEVLCNVPTNLTYRHKWIRNVWEVFDPHVLFCIRTEPNVYRTFPSVNSHCTDISKRASTPVRTAFSDSGQFIVLKIWPEFSAANVCVQIK